MQKSKEKKRKSNFKLTKFPIVFFSGGLKGWLFGQEN